MAIGSHEFLLFAFCFMLCIVPQVEIIAEREARQRWEFHVQILDDAGGLRCVHMTLSWADYNLWSADGADEPSKVAEAVLWFLLQREPLDALPQKFDASFARRKCADADQAIPSLIRR